MANKTLIETECFHCGASLNVDLDNLVSTCPYCDQKVLINPDAYKDIIAEHEATKREEMRIAHEKEQLRAKKEEKEKRKKLKRTLGVVGGACLFIGYFSLPFAGSASGGFIMVGFVALGALMTMSNNDKKAEIPTIVSVSIASSETSKDVGSVVARSVVGGTLLGPLGLLMGFTGKDKTETTFLIEYSNGKKGVETVSSDSDRYKELCYYLRTE